MKLTITDDNKEAGPDVVFVGITIFASIVGMLNKLHCLPRDAEHRNGAVLPQQDGLSTEEAKPIAFCDKCQKFHEA